MENKKLTISDVATALNVSKSTVSRAISGKGRVGDETKQRVLAYIEKNNYVPSAMAKGLAQQRTYNIGLTMPEDFALIDLPFFKKCMMGICQYAGSRDYDVVITMVSNDDVSQLERMVNNRKVDGVVLSRTFTEDKAVDFLKTKNIPFVTIGSSPDKAVIQVDNDHQKACKALTSTLIKHRIEKIALMCGNTSQIVNNSRLGGFIDAMQEAGIFNAKTMIFTEAEGPKLEKYVDRIIKEKFDCILCMDDEICLRVLDILKIRGVMIPDEIRVASFYNSTLLERNVPSITTLEFNAYELGLKAGEILLDLIDEKEVPGRTLLDYAMVIKESTGTWWE